MPDDHLHQEILAAVNVVTGSEYSASDVSSSMSIFELGVDSLSIVELIMSLEAALNISIPFEDLTEETFQSVMNLAGFLREKQHAASPESVAG